MYEDFIIINRITYPRNFGYENVHMYICISINVRKHTEVSIMKQAIEAKYALYFYKAIVSHVAISNNFIHIYIFILHIMQMEEYKIKFNTSPYQFLLY